MVKNQYREAATWQQFNRVHELKLKAFMVLFGAYIAVMTGMLVAQHYGFVLWGGRLGALLNLIFGLGGQLVMLFIAIVAFDAPYRRWHGELAKIFGSVGRQTRLGAFGFYRFMFNPRPADTLAAILDQKLEIQELGEEHARLERERDGWNRKLEIETLKLQLAGLDGKFREGSSEQRRLERALRKCADPVALRRLLEELTKLEPHRELPSEAPNGPDRIEELIATFREEERDGTDEEATRLFHAALQEESRKGKRMKLVAAIGKLRAANRRRKEQEEKAASRRHRRAAE